MANYYYHGNTKPYAAVLCHSADLARVEPVLAEIEKKGLRLCLIDESSGKPDARLKKACGVICVLTENFSKEESEDLQSCILQAEASGKSVIPVRTDSFELPDFLKRMTYASNSINLSKYTPEQAAARILTAPALAEPKITNEQENTYRRTAALLILAAVVLAAAIVWPLLMPLLPEESAAPETPAPVEIHITENWDITEEDLLNIKGIAITGDKVEDADEYSSVWTFLNSSREDDRDVWYRLEDGTEVEQGSIQDLSFLARFPNLETLVLVNQTAEEFPDLSGLEHLKSVELWNCAFKDLEGLRGSSLNFLHITLEDVTDLSPLTDCVNLTSLHVTNCFSLRNPDSFCPPNLSELQMDCVRFDNINFVSGLTNLETLIITLDGDRNAQPDLSPLASCVKINELNISADGCTLDLSPLGGMTNLSSFACECANVRNIEATGRPSLTDFELLLNEEQPVDLSFLSSCRFLEGFAIGSVETSLDFFSSIGRNAMNYVNLRGRNIDFNGLGALKRINLLDIDMEGENASGVLRTLADTQIETLYLSNCAGINLHTASKNVQYLKLRDCPLTALEGISGGISGLELENMNSLTSLKGLEKHNLDSLSISCCMHITDWEALESATVKKLAVSNQFNLPDFGRLNYDSAIEIVLENIAGMTDLSCFDAIPGEILSKTRFTVEALGDELTDISALSRVNTEVKGVRYNTVLTVNPALEDQAKELVENGCFGRYELKYPEAGWENVFDDYYILSLDELNSLPKSVLKKIKQLVVAGNEFYRGGWCEYNSINGRKDYYFWPWADDDNQEEVYVDEFGPVTDLSTVSEMTGLERLLLMRQPLESLEGIQNLENLRELTIYGCPGITDYSPVFALGSLEELRLEGENVSSIEGIQNLYNLRYLNLRDTYVTDLSPIGEISFSEEVYEDGFDLTTPACVEPDDTKLAFLADIPKFCRLEMAGIQDGSWTEYLQGTEVREAHIFCMNDTQTLESFVSAVTGLRYLRISWQPGIDDLECLENCGSLETLVVSYDMTGALSSLEKMDYGFELEIER